MKINELKKKSVDELERLAFELRESLRIARFGAAGSRARDVKHGKTVRRDIARIETELTLRSIAQRKKSL